MQTYLGPNKFHHRSANFYQDINDFGKSILFVTLLIWAIPSRKCFIKVHTRYMKELFLFLDINLPPNKLMIGPQCWRMYIHTEREVQTLVLYENYRCFFHFLTSGGWKSLILRPYIMSWAFEDKREGETKEDCCN